MDNIIFNIDGHKDLVNKIAKQLNFELGKVKTFKFVDGEIMPKALNDVKNKNCFIIQSTNKPAIEHIFKILLLIDSLHNGGASKINLIIPYFGFARQERVSWINEPNSCKVVSKMLSISNVDTIAAIDLHHPIIYSFFKNGVNDIRPYNLFKDYYLEYFKNNNISVDDVVIVAPDHGANKRAHELSDALNLKNEVVILTKHRPRANQSEVLAISGDVNKKHCIIIDDIIDTGKTIYNAARICLDNGALAIHVGATHGVFSKGYQKYLNNEYINDVVVLNTINKKYPNWVSVLDITPLLIENIKDLI